MRCSSPRFTSIVPLVTAALAIAFLVPAQTVAAEPPAFAAVTGHALGERVTVHAEMVRYLEALAKSSERVTLLEQGRSWEGRRLLAAVVTAPENQARLEEIAEASRRLADPRITSDAAASEIAASQPVTVWLGGSIHGNELSGAEGLLQVLGRLAGGEDAATVRLLEGAVVIIDPMLNPDGRDAFAAAVHRRLGTDPVAGRDHWTNDWTFWESVGFRTGHYYFDTNRDWFAHTQRETRQRVETLETFAPQVMVDAHEMGPDVEFYFDPAADPYGPHFPDYARWGFELFHQAYAEAFDAAGFEYMSRERYNYFYPGYTTSYGSYRGAVGMLYEQGTSSGLAIERADRSVRTLGDALAQQATAAWAAISAAVERREEILHRYREAHERAIEEGREGVRRYLLAPGDDPGHRAALVRLLLRNDIEVGRLTEPATLSGVRDREGRGVGERRFPVGTFVIEAAQPRNRLIRTLLEPERPISEEFLAGARERLERGEDPRFYDITTSSLPLLFDVDGASSTDDRELAVEPVVAPVREPVFPAEPPAYAYLVDGRQAASVAAVHALRRDGYRVAVTLAPTRIDGRDLASGTAVVRIGQNPETVHDAVAAVAERFRLDVVGTDTGLTDRAPGNEIAALGSGRVLPVRPSRVALLAGPGVHGYSFGWAWYTLDRRYRLPVTVRRVETLSRTPLDEHDVVVLPDLGVTERFAAALGEAGRERLVGWVRDGGTLVAIGEAVEWVRTELELAALGSFYGTPEETPSAAMDDGEEPARIPVPGAIVRTVLDPEAWLAAGYEEAPAPHRVRRRPQLPVLVDSARLLTPPGGPPDTGRRVVAHYATPEEGELVLSGQVWEESVERLPGKVFLYEERLDRGRVVAFVEDPCYRAIFRGAERLFLNAVVLGPSAP